MSCYRLSIRHRYALRLPLRCQPRRMTQSWSHHHRPITHNLRHRPAPYLRSVASHLMAQCNPESCSLCTDFLHRLPSRRRHNCSPCTARLQTSSSTTHGLVTLVSQAIAHHRYFGVIDQVGQSPIPSQRQQVLGIHVDPALSGASTHPKRRRTYVWGDGGSVGTGAWLPHQAH